tara:strand:- start:136 stop:435 length:300 start_codon:yes stop_codon:yes gene_type:complete
MKRTCWGCFYENNGLCHWFKLAKKSAPKQIPEEVFDKACPQYKNNKRLTPLTLGQQRLIKAFDGEIIGTKHVPFINFYKRKKRKYVKSPHKYAYRKDAQ